MALCENGLDSTRVERAAPKLPSQAGRLPIVFTDNAYDDVAEVFSGGSAVSSFGANQVIIVRNQEAKAALPERLRGALVMTPLEAKGLEFQDVFIFNFFKPRKNNRLKDFTITFVGYNHIS